MKENMVDAIEWFELQKKKKPQNIAQKDRMIIKEMEKLTDKGLSDFKDFFKTEEDYLLNRGLQKTVEAGDKFYKLQRMFQPNQRK